MTSIDEMSANLSFTKAKTGAERTVTFLPEPERAGAATPSSPSTTTSSSRRTPSKVGCRRSSPTARRGSSRRTTAGRPGCTTGRHCPNVGFNAVVGRPVSEYGFEPARFDQMRRGAWDIHARVEDMDLNGVYASLNFPSFLPGFAGQRLQQVTNDRDLAMACVRAWNDWHIDAWAGAYPDRIIPCQLPWLLDPEVGAKMIYENAERGYQAVTFSENPAMLGTADHPLRATGIRSWRPVRRDRDGREPAHRFVGHVAVDHRRRTARRAGRAVLRVRHLRPRWTGCTRASARGTRPEDLHVGRRDRLGGRAARPPRPHAELPRDVRNLDGLGETLTPAEVLKRNFWFCAVEDPSSFIQHERIGSDNILLEADYPHCDSTWPHTQRTIHEQIGGLPDDIIRKVTWENASRLYQHPVPAAIQADPNAF